MPEAGEDHTAKRSRIHELESFDKQLMPASDLGEVQISGTVMSRQGDLV